MSSLQRLQPVVTNQSKVIFESYVGDNEVSFSNTVITPVLSPVLTLVKSADKTSVSLGETLVYTLVAVNSGNVSAQVTAVDLPPEGSSFIINSVIRDGVPLPGIVPGSGIPLGIIAPRSQVTVSFQAVVVSLPATSELRNRALAQYSFTTPEGRLVNDEVPSNEVVVSLQTFQLATRLTANTQTTFIGDAVTYTLLLRNEGSLQLRGIVAVIPVPEGAEFIPGSVVAGGVYSPGSVPSEGIVLGILNTGAAAEISFRVRVTAAPPNGVLETAADISYEANEGSYYTDSNALQIRIIIPGVNVSLKVNYYSATPGDTLRYEFSVRNSGNQAVDAMLVDALPAGALFVWDSISVNGAPLKGIRPGEGIPLGALRAGASTVVALLATIPDSTDVRQVPALQNQGSVQYTFALPDGRSVRQNVRSNTVTTLLFAPIISVQIAGAPPIVEPGGSAIFTISLLNSGNYPANVSVIRIVPQGSVIDPDIVTVSALSIPESAAGGTVPLGIVEPGQHVQLHYHVRINPDFMSRSLQGSTTAVYTYTIDGRQYSGETRSNAYKLIVEEISE